MVEKETLKNIFSVRFFVLSERARFGYAMSCDNKEKVQL
jgi:hypothetical protein